MIKAEASRTRRSARRRGEGGAARLNFLILLLVLTVIGYALYLYAPVAYNAFLFKDYMQETVNKGAFPPGQTTDWVVAQLRASADEYDLPDDAVITAQNVNGRLEARVRWVRPIELPGYTYEYKFDHTVRSSGFLNPQ